MQPTSPNSLSKQCLLVRLSISSYTGTKTDKVLTKETARRHDIQNEYLRVSKSLVSKEMIAPYKNIETEARQYHIEHTLPWDENGVRILPAVHYTEYMEAQRERRALFEKAAEMFIVDWPNVLAAAKTALGTSFNEADYPSTSALKNAFKFRIKVDQLPEASQDFRCTIPASEIEEVRKEWAMQVETAKVEAQRELYARLLEPLSNMAERLRKEEGVFRDSLVDNVLDIVELIPSLNITQDPKIAEFGERIRKDFYRIRPNDLRHDIPLRKNTVKKVDAILAEISEFMPATPVTA